MTVSEVNACRALADVCRDIASLQPSPNEFLRLLGERAAGIRRHWLGLLDLMRGGQNLIVGRGFRPEFDDGSDGQVRHFIGITVAATIFGPHLTKWLSILVLRDAPDTPDGRLSDAAIDFSQQILSGQVAVAEAGDWIIQYLAD